MLNNDNAAGTVAPLMVALFFSLIFSSVAIAYFVTEMNISDCSNDKECIVPHITLPISSLKPFAQTQNFISGIYDKNIWASKDGTFINVPNIGEIGTGYLLIDNLNFNSDDEITNRYIINNSAKENYAFIIVYTGGYDADIIIVTVDGLYLTSSMNAFIMYKHFFPYTNANQILHPTITTTYNKKLHTCNFDFNGVLFTTDKITPVDGLLENTGFFGRYYGGIYTTSAGFALEQFYTSNPVNGESANNNGLSNITGFITTAILILGWTLPEEILPLILNILLIKTQLVALVICFAQFIRGG